MKLEMLVARAKYYEKTQKAIAKKLEISESKFSDWKAGKTKPTPFEIFRIAEMARLEPEKTFYDVMSEIDKDNEKYWCAQRESNPRPSASEVVSVVKLFCNFMLIIQANLQHRHIEHNLNVHTS